MRIKTGNKRRARQYRRSMRNAAVTKAMRVPGAERFASGGVISFDGAVSGLGLRPSEFVPKKLYDELRARTPLLSEKSATIHVTLTNLQPEQPRP